MRGLLLFILFIFLHENLILSGTCKPPKVGLARFCLLVSVYVKLLKSFWVF